MDTNSSRETLGPPKLVICGGGAAAVLFLAALRTRCSEKMDITVIEPRENLGLGVAYSTQCALHLLNTRVRNMSAGDDPNDFLNWLRRTHARRPLNWTRNCFAPRRLYGEYLQSRLTEIRSAPNVRFRWLRSSADSIAQRDGDWEVVPAKGEPVRADVVILATGNEAPRQLSASTAPQARPFIIDDPWDSEAKSAIAREAGVLLVGTGLTAIDVAVELLHRGHAGPIYAASRRGLLPRRHGPVHATLDGCGTTLPSSLRDLVRHVRGLVESDPRGSVWPGFVNEMRSVAPTLWSRWDVAERRCFLRHVRPFWDVHRHRIAPQVHSRIERAIGRGQLRILRGRVAAVEPVTLERIARVTVRQQSGTQQLDVSHIINCTGPESDTRRSLNPLLQNLVGDGLAKPDTLGLGFAVDRRSRLVAADGSAHRSLYALGSLTRGSRWEVTAVAEIRDQAIAVARRLAREFAVAENRAPSLPPLGIFRHSIA